MDHHVTSCSAFPAIFGICELHILPKRSIYSLVSLHDTLFRYKTQFYLVEPRADPEVLIRGGVDCGSMSRWGFRGH